MSNDNLTGLGSAVNSLMEYNGAKCKKVGGSRELFCSQACNSLPIRDVYQLLIGSTITFSAVDHPSDGMEKEQGGGIMTIIGAAWKVVDSTIDDMYIGTVVLGSYTLCLELMLIHIYSASYTLLLGQLLLGPDVFLLGCTCFCMGHLYIGHMVLWHWM